MKYFENNLSGLWASLTLEHGGERGWNMTEGEGYGYGGKGCFCDFTCDRSEARDGNRTMEEMLSFWGGPQRLPTQSLIKAPLFHIPAPPFLSYKHTHSYLTKENSIKPCVCVAERQIARVWQPWWFQAEDCFLKQSQGGVIFWSPQDESRINMVNMPGNFGKKYLKVSHTMRGWQLSEKWQSPSVVGCQWHCL